VIGIPGREPALSALKQQARPPGDVAGYNEKRQSAQYCHDSGEGSSLFFNAFDVKKRNAYTHSQIGPPAVPRSNEKANTSESEEQVGKIRAEKKKKIVPQTRTFMASTLLDLNRVLSPMKYLVADNAR